MFTPMKTALVSAPPGYIEANEPAWHIDYINFNQIADMVDTFKDDPNHLIRLSLFVGQPDRKAMKPKPLILRFELLDLFNGETGIEAKTVQYIDLVEYSHDTKDGEK